MDPLILGLVLLAAALHASWNALVKVGADALVRLAIVNTTAALCAVPVLFFAALPEQASWPYLLGSVLVHQAYYIFLALSYRVGDLSLVYPIARGVAPLLVAVGAFLFADERLSIPGILAVALISAAILSLAFDSRQQRALIQPVLFALGTGLTIAAYTVLDGLGGRAAGSVLGYIAWLFVLEGFLTFVIALALRQRTLLTALRQNLALGMLGGAFAFSAYGLVIWAMSQGPLTFVAALRETSVILAAWLGTRWLREPLGARRIKAAALVAVGVVLLQVSRAA